MKLSTPLALLVAALIQATSAGAAPGYDASQWSGLHYREVGPWRGRELLNSFPRDQAWTRENFNSRGRPKSNCSAWISLQQRKRSLDRAIFRRSRKKKARQWGGGPSR